MRVTLLVIVSAVVILILAVVLVTIFSGGIERFLQIWGVFSTEQLVSARCQTKCQELCANSGAKSGKPLGWTGSVKVGGATYSCSQYGFTCDCSRYMPGSIVPGTSAKKKVGEPCNPANPSECETGKCDPSTKKCVQ